MRTPPKAVKAYSEGRLSWGWNIALRDNPYPMPSEERFQWDKGWIAANAEYIDSEVKAGRDRNEVLKQVFDTHG